MHHRTRIHERRQPSSRAMAEWLFDHGYGHIDEPRFSISLVLFYPSDFLPQNSNRLKDKTRLCRTLLAENNSQESFEIELGDVARRSYLFDLEQCQSFNLDSATTPNEFRLSRTSMETLLDLMENRKLSLFKPELIHEAFDFQSQDREAFVDFASRTDSAALEYLIRRGINVHLSEDFDDNLGRISTYIPLLNDTPKPSNNTLGRNAPMPILSEAEERLISCDLTVGCTILPEYSLHTFYHELAHDLFNHRAYSAVRLSEDEQCTIHYCIKKVRDHITDQLQPLIVREGTALRLTHSRGQVVMHLKDRILTDLFQRLNPIYCTQAQQVDEICSDMLALSFTALAGEHGAQKLRDHYKDNPEFAEAVIVLRDTVRGIFDARLEALRGEKALPPELLQRTMQR